MLYPVLSWYPLLVPQQLFVDRQGETNAFYETNPAAIFSEDGTLCVAIRLVNYRKFHNRAFKMGGRFSESRYVLWRGTFNDTGFIPISDPTPIQWSNPFTTYGSEWTGYEDLRYLTPSQIIVTAPELSPRGEPRLVAATLSTSAEAAKTTVTTLLEPSARPEKNWMPFSAGHVVYSVCPFVVKRLETDVRATLVSEARLTPLAGYHGSSNGVVYGSGQLFLIHKFTERTEHRWLFVDFAAGALAFSEPFTFLPHSYIEFTCSLALISSTSNELLIGLGVNDDKAFLIRVRGPDLSKFTEVMFG